MKNFEIPKKPATQKAQIDCLWDVVCNHILTCLHLHDMKLKFLIALTAINVALLGVVLFQLVF